MANFFPFVKFTICLVLLALSFVYGNAARILDQVSDTTDNVDPTVAPVVSPDTTLPSGQVPPTDVTTPVPLAAPLAGPSETPPVVDDPSPVATPATNVAPTTTPTTTGAGAGATTTTSGAGAGAGATTTTSGGGAGAGATTSGGGVAAATASGAVDTSASPDHTALSFFMHDILGGTNPSGRVVTGIVANTNANGLPFSKPNNQVFPINGGVPLNNINGVINNNNYPFLVGLNGSPSNTITSNNGNNNALNNNNNNNQPFVTAGQLPSGLTLQQLMFGSVTVVDNEITEGQELGTSVLGKAQGFYLASSLDGSSHTLALTVLFHGTDHEVDDTISFFGVHRTATQISHLAIIGGTGKYENGKGYATIETDLHHEDQHTTDGVETITHFTVYFTP